jgi:hypothetical protein
MSAQLNGRFLPAELYGFLPAELYRLLPAKLHGLLPAEYWRTYLPAECSNLAMPHAGAELVSDEGA